MQPSRTICKRYKSKITSVSRNIPPGGKAVFTGSRTFTVLYFSCLLFSNICWISFQLRDSPTWYHLALVYNGGEMKLYLSGTVVATLLIEGKNDI